MPHPVPCSLHIQIQNKNQLLYFVCMGLQMFGYVLLFIPACPSALTVKLPQITIACCGNEWRPFHAIVHSLHPPNSICIRSIVVRAVFALSIFHLHLTSKYTSLLPTVPCGFVARHMYWPCVAFAMPCSTSVWLVMIMPRDENSCTSCKNIWGTNNTENYVCVLR